jgi:hypothetical protein
MTEDDVVLRSDQLATEFVADLDAQANSYLSHPDPILQSGFGGGAVRWRQEREPILNAIDRSGSLIDVGCANGYLVESLVAWGRERGIDIEPYGVDYSPALVDAARRRLPHWSDRFFVGNAWEWCPDRRFDFVYSLYDNVPTSLLAQYVERLLTHFVSPAGTVIIGAYGSRSKQQPAFDVAAFLADAGFRVASRVTAGEVPEARFASIVRGP